MKRVAFYVSDGTGITAEALGHSMLTQFGSIEFDERTLPYVQDEQSALMAVKTINEAAAQSGNKPIVFCTIVEESARSVLHSCDGLVMDFFDSFLSPLEKELGTVSSHTIGQSHSIKDKQAYNIRIDAIHFALDNDDGARTRHYDQADIILVGVSRSGKTPTSLYLALQFGLYAANYPLTEDDLDDLRLPKSLQPHKDKLFGLKIDVDRLVAIRNERKSGSKYASFRQCEMEIRGVEALYNKANIPSLDTTDLSIEEISTRIIQMAGIKRRIQ